MAVGEYYDPGLDLPSGSIRKHPAHAFEWYQAALEGGHTESRNRLTKLRRWVVASAEKRVCRRTGTVRNLALTQNRRHPQYYPGVDALLTCEEKPWENDSGEDPVQGSVFRKVAPMLILFYLAAIVTVDHEPARADSRRALLMPGKKTLYQRVITHPGARLYAGASSASALQQVWVRPFTAYYVFGTAQTDDTQWLEVGLASSGTPDGWIEAGKTSPWLQALTLKFTERTGRQPVLFFKDMVDLEAVAADRDPAGRYLDLMNRFSDVPVR